MTYSLLYVTVGSYDDALDLARTLVSERLIACANVIDGARSIYRWDGETREETEAIMVAKTTKELLTRAIDRVVELHAYECPCAVSMPIEEGYTPFLNWVGEEVASPENTMHPVAGS